MPKLTYYYLEVLQCEKSGYLECYIAAWIWKIVPFTLVLVGVVGNVLSLVTFSSRKLRKKSTCVYLILLAVCDTIVLCTATLNRTIKVVFGVYLRGSSTFTCMVYGWIISTSGMSSSWTIVAITAERALVTLFPTTAKQKMTPKNAVIISVSLVGFFLLLNGHLFYSREIMENQFVFTVNNETGIETRQLCLLRSGKYSEFYNGVWKKLLLIIGSVLPFVLILLGNATVAISLIKSRRAVRRVQNSDGRTRENLTRHFAGRSSNYKMFFILCTVFLVATVPYGVFNILIDTKKSIDEYTLAKYQLSSVIMRCLFWSNYSLNFFLYCMTGSLFRKELKRLFESAHSSFSALTARWSSVQPQFQTSDRET